MSHRKDVAEQKPGGRLPPTLIYLLTILAASFVFLILKIMQAF